MARYEFTAGRSGQPGILNTATYNPSAVFTPNSISPTNAYAAMDNGVYLNHVVNNARGKLVYANPNWQAEAMPIPSGHKPQAVFYRWSELNVDETNPAVYKLAEGVTPSHDFQMAVTMDTISPEQYGLVMYYSDVIGAVSFLSFKTFATERLGWGLGRVVDALVKNHLITYLTYEPLTAEGTGVITWNRLLRARAKLDAGDISPPPSEGDCFPMVVHTNQLTDLLKDSDVKQALLYSQKGIEQGGLIRHPSVLGEVAGFRFYATTRCAVNTVPTPNRYINTVIGRDLIAATYLQAPEVGQQLNFGSVYGMGGVDGGGGTYSNNAPMPMNLIEYQPGSGGATGDPLNQVGSMGVKWTHGLKIINPTYGFSLEFQSAYM